MSIKAFPYLMPVMRVRNVLADASTWHLILLILPDSPLVIHSGPIAEKLSVLMTR